MRFEHPISRWFLKAPRFESISSHGVHYKRESSAVLDRDNVGLVSVLNLVPSRRGAVVHTHGHTTEPLTLVIANTHLLFNPRRGDVKLAQLHLLSFTLEAVRRDVAERTGRDPFIAVMGDFNFTPDSGLYKYMTTGDVDLSNVRIEDFSGQQRVINARSRYPRIVEGHAGSGSYVGKWPETAAKGNAKKAEAHDEHSSGE